LEWQIDEGEEVWISSSEKHGIVTALWLNLVEVLAPGRVLSAFLGWTFAKLYLEEILSKSLEGCFMGRRDGCPT